MEIVHKIDEAQFDKLLDELERRVEKFLIKRGIVEPLSVEEVISSLPVKTIECTCKRTDFHSEDCAVNFR